MITGGGVTVAIPVPLVYPIPASEIRIEVTKPAAFTLATPDAVPTPDDGVVNVRVGSIAYPLPLDAILTVPIPAEFVTKYAVAAAPTPYVVEPTPITVDAALTIVTVGATVYPAPGFVNSICLTENTLLTLVVIATAVASIPPTGAVDIETFGVLVYPDPSSFRIILRTYPEVVVTPKVAVDPMDINCSDVIYP